MPTTIKKCNLCHAELRVSNEAQVVECPACGSINSYGYSRSNQNDKYNKGAPSNKNTGVMPNSQNYQQQPLSEAPTQGQTQRHVLLGGSLHFVDHFQQPPRASPEYSPPLAMTNSFLQPPPQGSLSAAPTQGQAQLHHNCNLLPPKSYEVRHHRLGHAPRVKINAIPSKDLQEKLSSTKQACRGNMTGAPTNYINKPVTDADDDPHYTKRRLKEFREKLQI